MRLLPKNVARRQWEFLVLLAVLTFAHQSGSQVLLPAPQSSGIVDPIGPVQRGAKAAVVPFAPAMSHPDVVAGSSARPNRTESASADRQSKVPPGGGEDGFELLIGPGDLIEVSVYGAPDYVKDVRVQATGDITLPFAGRVTVGGLTPAQAEALLAKRFSDGDYFTDARVSVIEKETATQGISVLGEVQKPGVYPLPGPRRLFDAISAAGGTTARAGGTASVLHRADPLSSQVIPLSYEGDASGQSNIYVYPGDTVIVAKAGIVYVIGDVRLPGGFVMDGSRMTILEALAMAQGANRTAALDRAQLIHREGEEHHPESTTLSLKNILAAKASDVNLRANDIIFVPTSGAKAVGRRTLEAIVQTATGIAIYSRVP